MSDSRIANGCAIEPERAPAAMLDVRDIAAMLQCSVRSVYRMSDGGKMPRPIKLGQLCRWRKAEVLDWISAGCRPVRAVRGAGR